MTLAGLRPGEKLFEEKLMAEEGLKKTKNKLIHIGYVIYKYRLKKPVTGFFVKYAGYLGVMAAVWGITEYFCRFISGQAFMILVCRLGICLIVPNILLWFAYRRTAEWKVLWNLLKKIVEKVFTGDKR